MKKTIGCILGSFWIGTFFWVRVCHADPPKIDLPNQPSGSDYRERSHTGVGAVVDLRQRGER